MASDGLTSEQFWKHLWRCDHEDVRDAMIAHDAALRGQIRALREALADMLQCQYPSDDTLNAAGAALAATATEEPK